MSDTEDKLFDLLDEWALLHKQGKDVLVQELCRDCPELVDELEHRVSVLKATDWLDQSLDDGDEKPLDKTKPSDFGFPEHLGRYRLDELIGEGGFGQVWRGFDSELHRKVAIKIPRPDRISTPERIEQFVQEARRVAQLKHPGVVPIYDVGRDDKLCFIVCDLVEGKNLAEVIAEERHDAGSACRIVAEVARVLQHAHDQGFVHRDIKPSNLLLDHQSKVFLTDFGIAATVEELEGGNRQSVGTLAYMSPEQIANESVDARTDIYSLGLVLFELLTGERLIAANDPRRAREQIERGAIPLLEAFSIPAELKAICRKCLAQERESRFEKANDLANALDKFLNKRSRVGLWIGMVGAVVLVGIVVVLWKANFWSEKEAGTLSEQPVVVSSDDRKTIVISEPRRSFEQSSPISSLAFDSSAERVVIGSTDGTTRLLKIDGDETQTIKLDNASEVTAIAVSPNGSRLACGCANGLVRMWDLSQSPPKELSTLAGHSGRVRDLVFNHDGTVVVSGSDDKTAQVWDLTLSPPQLAKLPPAEGPILAVKFVGDELAVGIGSASENSGQLWFWRVALAQQQLRPIDTKTLDRLNGIEDIAFSADGRFVVVVHDGGKIAGLELETHPEHRRRAIRMIGFLDRQSEPISTIAVLPGSKFSVVVSRGSRVELWNLRTTRQVARIEQSDSILSFAVSQDGRVVATGTQSHVRIWRMPDDFHGSE